LEAPFIRFLNRVKIVLSNRGGRTMDRALLADFLRARREALQPEDVGLPRGQRRRTGGLRREEVAALAGMSADYYSRIEQQRGPAPSERMLVALARALRLNQSERDHLFVLGGIPAPRRILRDDYIGPTMMRIVADLSDVPAIVLSRLGEALLQTPPAVALLGDYTQYTGMSRYLVHRWSTAGSPVIRGFVACTPSRTIPSGAGSSPRRSGTPTRRIPQAERARSSRRCWRSVPSSRTSGGCTRWE